MAITDTLPNISFGGFSNAIIYFIIFLAVIIVVGIIMFFLIQALRYKYKIVVFENLSGKGYVPTRKDRAAMVKLGDGGAEVLHLLRNKTYKNAYGKKMGKNTYWFVIGSDGFWYNVTIGDLDAKFFELGVVPVDRDMRYMQIALQRNLRERFEKITFWQKYGGLVAYTVLILITGILMYLLFDKWLDVSNGVSAAVEAAQGVVEASERLLGGVDAVQSSGGLTPA